MAEVQTDSKRQLDSESADRLTVSTDLAVSVGALDCSLALVVAPDVVGPFRPGSDYQTA